MGEIRDALLGVVHAQASAARLREIEDLHAFGLSAVGGGEDDLEFSGLVHHKIGGSVLVAEGVTADHDRLGPLGDQFGDIFAWMNALQMMGSRKTVPPR